MRIQHRLAEWTKQGRKHWDLYRWLLDPILLSDALRLVMENDGCAGVDQMSCSDIKGKEWEFVTELSNQLRRKAYHPRPVKRVYIPKRDGKRRPLGIPTIRDRVVQRALVLVLEPVYEQLFLPCSHGFRPNKSAANCIAEVASETYRHRHVLEADIESFFDNVSHQKLLGMLKHQIVDPRVLNLVNKILKAGFLDVKIGWRPTVIGTPQGGPLSPLLANIYLHYALDERFHSLNSRNARLIRFADDFVILANTKAGLLALRRTLYTWMREGGLKLKESKTRLVNMRNRYRSHESKIVFLGFKVHLRAYRDNPKRFWIARQPSESSRIELHENLRETLIPNLSHKEAAQKALLIWRGWTNYFRYGNSNRVFYREIRSVREAIRYYLHRKYRRQRRPVPWKRLNPLAAKLLKNIKPVRVIPDLLRQNQQQPSLLTWREPYT